MLGITSASGNIQYHLKLSSNGITLKV